MSYRYKVKQLFIMIMISNRT